MVLRRSCLLVVLLVTCLLDTILEKMEDDSMLTPDKGRLIMSSEKEVTASGAEQKMPATMRMPIAITTGSPITTPLKEA